MNASSPDFRQALESVRAAECLLDNLANHPTPTRLRPDRIELIAQTIEDAINLLGAARRIIVG